MFDQNNHNHKKLRFWAFWTMWLTVSVNDSTQSNVFVWTDYENSLKDVWFKLSRKNKPLRLLVTILVRYSNCAVQDIFWRLDAILDFFRHNTRRNRAFWTFLCINFLGAHMARNDESDTYPFMQAIWFYRFRIIDEKWPFFKKKTELRICFQTSFCGWFHIKTYQLLV